MIKTSGGKLVDPSPEIEKERASELDRLQKQYNPTNSNMTEFPKFQFKGMYCFKTTICIEIIAILS